MRELTDEQKKEMDRLGLLPPGVFKTELQLKLVRSTQKIEAFKYDDLIVIGEPVEIVTKYCRMNPIR